MPKEPPEQQLTGNISKKNPSEISFRTFEKNRFLAHIFYFDPEEIPILMNIIGGNKTKLRGRRTNMPWKKQGKEDSLIASREYSSLEN